MSAQILKFDNFALSSRGLLARPIMPNTASTPITKNDVQGIGFEVHNLTDGGAPVVGVLVLDDVMFDVPQPWPKDSQGYYFSWAFPGTLVPLADKEYRFVLTFTLKPTVLDGQSFILVWSNRSKSPTG